MHGPNDNHLNHDRPFAIGRLKPKMKERSHSERSVGFQTAAAHGEICDKIVGSRCLPHNRRPNLGGKAVVLSPLGFRQSGEGGKGPETMCAKLASKRVPTEQAEQTFSDATLPDPSHGVCSTLRAFRHAHHL